ncbi:MAG: hypothetical protein OEY14_12965 [Myxococcales bacterium]|nr:hypothetical protein [Myxococcales bacterium]
MLSPSKRLETVEELRRVLVERFREAIPEARSPRGPSLPSGWLALDAKLPSGGLCPGEIASLHAAPGSGALSLASSWAREASRRGEPTLVVDAQGSTLPHGWVIAPAEPRESWAALDIALRSGAFGLLQLLDPPSAGRGVGARLVRLMRAHEARLLLLHEASASPARHARDPFEPTHQLHLEPMRSRWLRAPSGQTPLGRSLRLRREGRVGGAFEVEIFHEDLQTDRLHPAPRIADRRASSRTARGQGPRG